MPYADPERRREYARQYYKSDYWHAWYRDYRNSDKRKQGERNAYLMRNYGISAEEYSEMMRWQNGCCAICLKPETEIGNAGVIRGLAVDHDHETGEIRGLLCRQCNVGLAVDHDHETGEIRGLLCRQCNVGLGHFQDDPVMLRLALAYLEGGDANGD